MRVSDAMIEYMSRMHGKTYSIVVHSPFHGDEKEGIFSTRGTYNQWVFTIHKLLPSCMFCVSVRPYTIRVPVIEFDAVFDTIEEAKQWCEEVFIKEYDSEE